MENTTYSPFEEIENLLIVKTEENEPRIVTTFQLLLAAQKDRNGQLKKSFIEAFTEAVKNYCTYYDPDKGEFEKSEGFKTQIRLLGEVESESALCAWAYGFNRFIQQVPIPDILNGAADEDAPEDTDFPKPEYEEAANNVPEDTDQQQQENGEAIVLSIFLWEKSLSPYLYVGNQSLAVFTHFCQSVLKAEYLYNDFLSKEKIVPLKKVLEETFFQKKMQI